MITTNSGILENVRNMSVEEQRNLTYDELKKMIDPMSLDEIIELRVI